MYEGLNFSLNPVAFLATYEAGSTPSATYHIAAQLFFSTFFALNIHVQRTVVLVHTLGIHGQCNRRENMAFSDALAVSFAAYIIMASTILVIAASVSIHSRPLRGKRERRCCPSCRSKLSVLQGCFIFLQRRRETLQSSDIVISRIHVRQSGFQESHVMGHQELCGQAWKRQGLDQRFW